MSLGRIKSSSQLRVEGPRPFQYAQRMQFSCGEIEDRESHKNGQAFPRDTSNVLVYKEQVFFQTGKKIDDHLEMVTETWWVLE